MIEKTLQSFRLKKWNTIEWIQKRVFGLDSKRLTPRRWMVVCFFFLCLIFPHLLLGCAPAALGGELQDSQQRSEPQAEGKNHKHPLQAVLLHSWRLGLVGHAAAGPPLASQVSQLPRLAQLEDCHAEVLYDGWALRKWMGLFVHFSIRIILFFSI